MVFGDEGDEDMPLRSTPVRRVKGGKNKDYLEFVDTNNIAEDDDEQPDDECADSMLDPADVRFAVVTESMRQEIYNLYKEDPISWTARALAGKYGMKLTRAKAILHLMRLREEAMERIKPSEQSSQEGWEALYRKHVEDPAQNTVEALSESSGYPLDKVQDIIARMKEHSQRSDNMRAAEESMQEQLAELELCGVDTRFQEVSKSGSKLEQKYFPELFGDDDFEVVSSDLRRRVIEDTKAKPTIEFPAFVRNRDQLKNEASQRIQQLYPLIPRSEKFMYKSKIAFRDLSLDSGTPTIIRTRTGK